MSNINRKMKPRKIRIKSDDIFNMVDAVFFSRPERPGWVEMYSNETGRNLVNGLFPKANIRWTDESALAAGWFGFEIDLLDVVANTPTRLPFDVMPFGMTIDECSPWQLAALLAFGVLRAGGRSALLGGSKQIEMFVQRDN